MLRITSVHDDEKHCRLTLCGQFTGEYVSELERALVTESATSQTVALDLMNVTFVDREAMMFLCGAWSRNIPIQNIPSYVQRWIQQEKRCGGSPDET